jgi:hypothetical protein
VHAAQRIVCLQTVRTKAVIMSRLTGSLLCYGDCLEFPQHVHSTYTAYIVVLMRCSTPNHLLCTSPYLILMPCHAFTDCITNGFRSSEPCPCNGVCLTITSASLLHLLDSDIINRFAGACSDGAAE